MSQGVQHAANVSSRSLSVGLGASPGGGLPLGALELGQSGLHQELARSVQSNLLALLNHSPNDYFTGRCILHISTR